MNQPKRACDSLDHEANSLDILRAYVERYGFLDEDGFYYYSGTGGLKPRLRRQLENDGTIERAGTAAALRRMGKSNLYTILQRTREPKLGTTIFYRVSREKLEIGA